MAVIRAAFTTIGQSSPASVIEDAEGTGYRWRKIPGWTPNDPRCREPGRGGAALPQNVKATSAKQRRITRYCELRLAGKTRTEAASDPDVLVGDSTSKAYEAEFKTQHPRGRSHDPSSFPRPGRERTFPRGAVSLPRPKGRARSR